MGTYSYLKDREFLKSLDNINNKFFWVKIEVLNSDEYPIRSIEGRVQPGSSISLAGSSSVRRTCTLNIIAEDEENDLTDIDNLLSANKKIKIFEGIKNTINSHYDDIIWFPLGVFVIVQPSISHSTSGCTIALTCKDKMCLLNGECAGGLPTSITFHEYDQIIGLRECSVDPQTDTSLKPNTYTIYSFEGKYYSWTPEYSWQEEANASSVGKRTAVPQLIYDIIQTLVCNYGGEDLNKIFINDVPLEIKQLVRYTGSGVLHYNTATNYYTLDDSEVTAEGVWRNFSYNEDVGYVYTDFTYPGSLVSSIGDNVCTILDKIKNTLGNYEYFYDVEGNFIFQEIKNYLNNSYLPLEGYRLDDYGKDGITSLQDNNLSIVDSNNYQVDFYSNTKSVYTFNIENNKMQSYIRLVQDYKEHPEDYSNIYPIQDVDKFYSNVKQNTNNYLVTSFSNTPNYTNLKNDFHIWGENQDGYVIHYHLAIKDKPKVMNTYNVVFLKKNDEYTGGLRLATDSDKSEDINVYIPDDWRAELYLQGLTAQQAQKRPDVYQQELLDLFDMIYDFKEKKFKTDLVYKPNVLNYFFDYLEPVSRGYNNNLYDCSVDTLGTKIYSYQLDKINRLYNTDVPNIIMLSTSMDDNVRDEIIDRCLKEGQPYANVNPTVYSKVSIGTAGYTAQETARDLLYQYTNYNESINIQSSPIYYLDVNTRITVQDPKTGIYGDYIINSISLPLDAGSTMSISASRALERI